MAVLLLDLDDTLVDRQAAFRGWAQDFVDGFGADPEEVDWLVAADDGGYAFRSELAAAIKLRYGVDEPPDQIVEDIVAGMLDHLAVDDAVTSALATAADAGWVPVVVTNGNTRRQEAKIRRTGLDRLVAGWVISEAVGIGKPDPRIFDLAVREVGGSLDSAWMIGDTAHADIVGASLAGIGSTWISHGRLWPFCLWSEQALVARTAGEAISVLAGSASVQFGDGLRGLA